MNIRSAFQVLAIITTAASCLAQSQQSATQIKPHGLWAISFSPDDKMYAFGGDDSTLHVYTTADNKLKKQFKLQGAIRNIQWHKDGDVVAISTLNNVQLFDVTAKKFLNVEGVSGARGLGWNYDGSILGVAGNGIVYLVSKQGKLVHSFPKHNNNSYLGLHWHPSKNIIATVTDEIILFDSAGKQLAFIKHRKEQAGILSVAWHPSGEFFVTGDYGHEAENIPTLLQYWKPDGTLIKTIKGNKEEIRNLAWSPDGKFLAVASDALRIYDEDGNLVTETKTSGYNLWGINWSNKGDKIITASFDGSHVEIWSKDGKPISRVH